MKIDIEVKKAEKAIKEKLNQQIELADWNFIEIQIIIQLAVEAVITKRVKKAVES